MAVASAPPTRSAAPERRLPPGTADAVVRRLFPKTHPHLNDPVGWFRERLRAALWTAQQEIAESVRDHRHTAVHGCHDFGKSFDAAGLACWWTDVHPPGDAFVVSTAPTQVQVNSILWREMRGMHARAALPGWIPPATPKWYLPSGQEVAFGRKPQDYVDPEQAMQAFQGIHARYVLVIIDEACGVPKWLFDAADTLATNEHSRILAIGNPDDPASHFAEVCKPGSGWNVIHVDAYDTPAFTGEPVAPELLEKLISPVWVEERRQRWGEESALFTSKVRGRFPDVSDDTAFPPAIIRKAHETSVAGLERGGYGGDVARFGDSETVVYRNRGGQIRMVYAARKQDTEETADAFSGILARHGAAGIPIVVDGDGVGGGVVDKLRVREAPVIEFRGGEQAYDDERYADRRAEIFWTLREGIEAGVVDLDPADDVLAAQLGKLKWKLDSKGRKRFESKEDMRRRGVKSPDRADAAAMAFAAPSTPASYEPGPEPPNLAKSRDPVLRGAEGLRAGETTLTGDLLTRSW